LGIAHMIFSLYFCHAESGVCWQCCHMDSHPTCSFTLAKLFHTHIIIE
jgi:hypothetical protein